jgi:hypothetical protein
MESKAFAAQLAAWMSPGVLARAAADWSKRPDGQTAVTLRIGTHVLKSGYEAQYDRLVRNFLDHVSIPDELICLTRGLYRLHVSDEAAEWLRKFRFTGTINFAPAQDPLQESCPLLEIVAPQCEVRVVWPPIEMLTELISRKADYWRRVAEEFGTQHVHHQAMGEWPFEAWIDLHVARACGFPDLGRAARVTPIPLVSNVRGHAVVEGRLPESSQELVALRVATAIRHQSSSRELELFDAIKRRSTRTL